MLKKLIEVFEILEKKNCEYLYAIIFAHKGFFTASGIRIYHILIDAQEPWATWNIRKIYSPPPAGFNEQHTPLEDSAFQHSSTLWLILKWEDNVAPDLPSYFRTSGYIHEPDWDTTGYIQIFSVSLEN